MSLAAKEANEPSAVTKGEYQDEAYDQHGEIISSLRTYYTCGSCIGDSREEVVSEYIHLITQLTRRSAFLTMYGLFEHRMSECLIFMIKLSGYKEKITGKGGGGIHTLIKSGFNGKGIDDVDHLPVIRNIMIHNDGVAVNYNKTLNIKSKKTDAEKRLLKAMCRAEGIKVNDFDSVLMDSDFLLYAIGEFERYIKNLEVLVQDYSKKGRFEDRNESISLQES